MLLLGLDTATPRAGVALGDASGIRASFHLVNEGRHAESLAPAIEFVCRLSGTPLKELTGVAVDIGPGLFTGLRVGLATAKAIAFAHDIPTIPVSSLEIVAFGARLTERTIVPVIDALSGEVYYGAYRADADGVHAVNEAVLATPEALASHVGSMHDDVLVVGDGARRYANVFSAMPHVQIADAGLQYPSAGALIEIAARKAARNEIASAADVQIFYLRKPYVHT